MLIKEGEIKMWRMDEEGNEETPKNLVETLPAIAEEMSSLRAELTSMKKDIVWELMEEMGRLFPNQVAGNADDQGTGYTGDQLSGDPGDHDDGKAANQNLKSHMRSLASGMDHFLPDGDHEIGRARDDYQPRPDPIPWRFPSTAKKKMKHHPTPNG